VGRGGTTGTDESGGSGGVDEGAGRLDEGAVGVVEKGGSGKLGGSDNDGLVLAVDGDDDEVGGGGAPPEDEPVSCSTNALTVRVTPTPSTVLDRGYMRMCAHSSASTIYSEASSASLGPILVLSAVSAS
jgi:hypothetical protein